MIHTNARSCSIRFGIEIFLSREPKAQNPVQRYGNETLSHRQEGMINNRERLALPKQISNFPRSGQLFGLCDPDYLHGVGLPH